MRKYTFYAFTFLLAFFCLFTITFAGFVMYGKSRAMEFIPPDISRGDLHQKTHLQFSKFYFYKHVQPMSCRHPGKWVHCVFIYEVKAENITMHIAWSPLQYEKLKTPVIIESR